MAASKPVSRCAHTANILPYTQFLPHIMDPGWGAAKGCLCNCCGQRPFMSRCDVLQGMDHLRGALYVVCKCSHLAEWCSEVGACHAGLGCPYVPFNSINCRLANHPAGREQGLWRVMVCCCATGCMYVAAGHSGDGPTCGSCLLDIETGCTVLD